MEEKTFPNVNCAMCFIKGNEMDSTVLKFLAGAVVDNKLYFIPYYTNTLFMYDLDKKKCEKISVLTEEKNAICLYRKAFLNGNDIWFVPWEAKKIVKYNILFKTIEYFDVGKTESNTWEDGFYEWSKQDNKIYCVSQKRGNAIYAIDLANNSVNKVCDTDGLPDSRIIGITVIGNDTLVGLSNGVLLLFNGLEWEVWSEIKTDESGIPFYSMISNKKSICLLPFDYNEVWIIDKLKKSIIEKIETDDASYFVNGIYDNESIICFPAYSNRRMSIYSLLNGNVIKHNEIILDEPQNEWLEIIEIDTDDKDKNILASSSGKIYIFDKNWQKSNTYKIMTEKAKVKREWKDTANLKYMSGLGCIEENEFIDLGFFIEALTKERNLYGK